MIKTNKAVLMSIRPKWCELIASGKKTIEVRKTKPKIQTPFKCYIYCTKDKKRRFWVGKKYSYCDDRNHNLFDRCGNGKVIGEFTCDYIETFDDNVIHSFSCEDYSGWNDCNADAACIHPQDLEDYANDSWLYGWHISELVIYDEPKELSDFEKPCPYDEKCAKCKYNDDGTYYEPYSSCDNESLFLSRPPQSWCYVKEREQNECQKV